ncbi:MAG: stage III sporulation protein AE [Clostridiales bacterium]|nr:stage III sporulation protein AE [Clostridiales bacterium]
MKRVGIALLALLLLLLCAPVCQAVDVTEAQWDSIDTEALEDAASASGAELELNETFNLNEALGQLGDLLAGQLSAAVKDAVGSSGVLLLIVLFCEVAEGLSAIAGGAKRRTAVIGTAAGTVVSVSDVSSLMELGKTAIERIDTFSNLLIPVITTCSVASGSVTGGVARQMATVFFSTVLITLIDRVLIPFVYLYTAACAAAAVVDNRGLGEIAKLLKWAVTSLLTVLLLLFTGYLSLTSVAAAGTDAVTIKLTRTVISSMVPVVGGILSNATETVLSGVGILKNLVGTFGVVAVLGFCVTPFLRLGAQYLAYRLAAVLAAVISQGKIPKLIDDIAGAFALVLGMTGTAALLVMISVFATLAVATG